MLLASAFLAISQAAAQATLAPATPVATAPTPDVSITARVRAREVKIEQQGEASARVYVKPSAAETIEVERNLPRGQTTYRNLDLKLTVEARLADPAAGPSATASAQASSEQPTGD